MHIQIAIGNDNFWIDYEPGAQVMTVDGVSVSTQIFRDMIVSPREDRWLRFRREGNLVSVDTKTEEV